MTHVKLKTTKTMSTTVLERFGAILKDKYGVPQSMIDAMITYEDNLLKGLYRGFDMLPGKDYQRVFDSELMHQDYLWAEKGNDPNSEAVERKAFESLATKVYHQNEQGTWIEL